jgi:stage IV sporulation protein B
LTQNEEVISINGSLSHEYNVDLSENLIFYSEKEGKYTLTANILGSIPYKQITVNVVPEIYLYASGDLIGVKMSTQGIIAVGFEDLTDLNGETIVSPAKKAGIQIGDVITAVNGIEINTADEFRSNVQEIEAMLYRYQLNVAQKSNDKSACCLYC